MSRLRAGFALILVYMIYAVLLNSVGTVILQSILSFHITKPEGSILEACKDLSIAAVSFAVASFMPRLGYRRAIIVALLAVAVACFFMRLFPAFSTTAGLFLVIGITFALVKVAVYSSIGLLHTDPKAHASFTGLVESFFMFAVLSGAWIFSAFIDPVHPEALSWLNVYIVLGIAALAAAALWMVTPLPPPQANPDAVKAAWYKDLSAIPELFAAPFLVAFLAGIFVYVLIEQSLGSWLPTYNREVLGLPAQMAVQAGGLYAAALALGRLAGGLVLRRVAWPLVLYGCVIGTACVVVASIVFAAHGAAAPGSKVWDWLHPPFQVFILPAAGFFFSPIYPTLNSIVLSALPQHRQAPMTGLIIAFSALGGTLGSFITGQVFSHFGGEHAFALTLIPLALLMLSLWFLRRRLV